MAIKKGDLVKVIQLLGNDEFCGVELNKTYKVVKFINNEAYINDGKGGRFMYNYQLEKAKKKSKKDLKIEELENQIQQMKDILNK